MTDLSSIDHERDRRRVCPPCKTAISFGSGLRIIIGERHTYAAPHGTHLTDEHGDRVILFLEEGNGQGPEAA